VIAAWTFSFGLSFIILKLTDAMVGLRVDEETESRGLDIGEHAEEGYILD
jgi:Amt family ammonium transporter